jgi:small subunit ribosomal protein S9
MTEPTTKRTKLSTKTGTYTEAVGRRKTAVARVRLYAAKNTTYTCNERALEAYFTTDELRTLARAAFAQVPVEQKYDISVLVGGGGMRAQAEAIRQGIARALTLVDGELRKPLKRAGFLARDARAKERRKFGLKKARKAPQWSKR